MVNQAKDHHSACGGPLSRRRFLEFGVPHALGFGLLAGMILTLSPMTCGESINSTFQGLALSQPR